MISPPTETENKSPQEVDAEFDRRVELVMQAVDAHHSYLLNYLTGLTRHPQDAENLVQDLWQHVLLHFKEEHIGSIGILRRKANQIFVDAYRMRKRRKEQVTDDFTGIEPQAKPYEPATEEEEQALEVRFWSEFPGIDLTEQQKSCLWKSARCGYSYHEIGEQLGIGKSTVGDAVTTARRTIKDYLENSTNS